jgi:LmbE family N-acetylglucosaminyl deacetylase
MNVLVIAPHPDDEVIGCGGAVCLHAAGGDRVSTVFLTSGELGLKHLIKERAWRTREAEARRAARILGTAPPVFLRRPDWILGGDIGTAAKALRPVLRRQRPELIYLPHPADGHPDHRATLPVLRAALRGSGVRAPELRGYEVWTPLAESDLAVDISRVIRRKLRALRAHRSQLGEFDYAQAVCGLGAYRGALAGKCAYAEVFQAIRLHPAR